MKKTARWLAILTGSLFLTASVLLPQAFASRRLVLEELDFKSNTSILIPDSDAELNKILVLLNNEPTLKIEIQGHTVPGKSLDADGVLSRQRAESVMNWLVARGIDSERITVVGYGSSKPLVENTTEKGRRINERIEIIKHYSTFPVVELAENVYSFEPLPEGSTVLHEFRVQNTGDAILEISKVKTG